MTLRFGDNFEIDAQARRLQRAGRYIKLERIPMEILLMLVERPGEIVTREQIVERVWGVGVYLDTDNGITHHGTGRAQVDLIDSVPIAISVAFLVLGTERRRLRIVYAMLYGG